MTAILAVGAVVSKFIDLPIAGDLVKFGLALGVFALIVNLGNSLTKEDDAKDKKVKGSSTKLGKVKGG